MHVPRAYFTEAPGRACQPSATPGRTCQHIATPAGVISLELNIIPIRDKTESTNLPPAGVYSLSARAAACTAGLAGSCAAIGTTEVIGARDGHVWVKKDGSLPSVLHDPVMDRVRCMLRQRASLVLADL